MLLVLTPAGTEVPSSIRMFSWLPSRPWLPCHTPTHPSSLSTIGRAAAGGGGGEFAADVAQRSEGNAVSVAVELLLCLALIKTIATAATRAAPTTDNTTARTMTVVLADGEPAEVDGVSAKGAATGAVPAKLPPVLLGEGVAPLPVSATALTAVPGGTGGGIGAKRESGAPGVSTCIASPVMPNDDMKARSKAVGALACRVTYISAAGWELSMAAIESVATMEPGTIADTKTEEAGTCVGWFAQ